jgi:iron complex outermembrane recepter protein
MRPRHLALVVIDGPSQRSGAGWRAKAPGLCGRPSARKGLDDLKECIRLNSELCLMKPARLLSNGLHVHGHKLHLRLHSAVVATLLSAAAQAQRADDNAVTTATDAFGTVVGTQTIGLYSATNARGFSPAQAENLRIEGLYFDQQTTQSNPFIFRQTQMRVGIAAQSYAFPAPSGIADMTPRTPGDKAGISTVLIRGPLQVASAELDAQYPLIDKLLSVGVILAAGHDFDYNYALRSNRRAISILARLRPSPVAEIVPFIGYIHNTEWRLTPSVYADGIHPLPSFDEQHLPTQTWTQWRWNELTAGIIARVAISDTWSVRSGLFRSRQEEYRNYNDLLLGLSPDGTAQHVMDVSPGRVLGSYSGDLRVVQHTSSKYHQHELALSVRGRRVDRRYGGDSVTDLGTASIYDHGPSVPEPAQVFSQQSLDQVRQTAAGINDIERWSHASLSVGTMLTDYTRTNTSADSTGGRQHKTATLPTISFTVNPTSRTTLYGSYIRGLEDSPLAPAAAVNRGEAPPATPTWQVDGGIAVTLPSQLRLLLGGFKVHKVYFNLDAATVYRNLGDISTEGMESSATWSGSNGLTIIAGGVWLRPEVGRHIAEQGGASGDVPIGPVPGTANVNMDFAPKNWRGWGTSLQWTWWSSRVETNDDRYRLPAYSTVNIGIRYLSKVFGHPWSARLDIGNVTNTPGLTLSSVYTAAPQLPRNYTLTLAADL